MEEACNRLLLAARQQGNQFQRDSSRGTSVHAGSGKHKLGTTLRTSMPRLQPGNVQLAVAPYLGKSVRDV